MNDFSCFTEGTYRLVIELDKSLEDLGDDRGPGCDIFGLRIEAQLVEVLQDTQTQPPRTRSQYRGSKENMPDLRHETISHLWSCCLVFRTRIVVHPQQHMH